MSQLVYRGYDQAALDREYNNRTKAPGFDFDAFQRWCGEESAAARKRHRCHLDIPYGPTAAEKLDIFIGDAAGGEVEIFFHGGYWRAFEKDEFSYVANGFVPRGVTTVVVNYALIPTVTMDQLVEQCRAAVRWVFEHIAEYGGDPARLSLSGHSAGGHLVAMMLATDWPAYAGMPADPFKRAYAMSGLYDLEPVRLCFINDILQLDSDTAARNSPVLLTPRHACELVVAVGDREGDEYLRQSLALVQAWSRDGSTSELSVLPDDHFSIRAHLGNPDSEMIERLTRRGD
jgi:arylformamidase